jgi:hypothetical protein
MDRQQNDLQTKHIRSEVLRAANRFLTLPVFWNVTPHRLAERYKHFGVTQRLLLEMWSQRSPSKR